MALKKNIFLTGFMGSGKTTAGQKLAKLLKTNFVDLDQYIEHTQKLTVQSLFDNFGEEAFRKIEQCCLLELINKHNNSVIALGGGTICYGDNLRKIKNAGCLVFIELPAITLSQRLEKSKNQRPLLKNLKGNELTEFVTNKLADRAVFYNQSDIKISGINLTPQILSLAIAEHRNKHA